MYMLPLVQMTRLIHCNMENHSSVITIIIFYLFMSALSYVQRLVSHMHVLVMPVLSKTQSLLICNSCLTSTCQCHKSLVAISITQRLADVGLNVGDYSFGFLFFVCSDTDKLSKKDVFGYRIPARLHHCFCVA